MKTYKAVQGDRAGVGTVRIVNSAEPSTQLVLYHDVRHSPDGFSWGYSGSGPAELARCILLDHLGHDQITEVERAYQHFKEDVVSRWGPRGFEITDEQIDRWLGQNGYEVAR